MGESQTDGHHQEQTNSKLWLCGDSEKLLAIQDSWEVPSMRQDTVKIFRPLSAQMPKLKNTVNDLGQEMPQCNSSKLSRLGKQNREDSILCAGVQEVSITFKNRIFMKVKTHHICTFILNTQRRLPIYNTHIIKTVGINEQIFRLNRIADLWMKYYTGLGIPKMTLSSILHVITFLSCSHITLYLVLSIYISLYQVFNTDPYCFFF